MAMKEPNKNNTIIFKFSMAVKNTEKIDKI